MEIRQKQNVTGSVLESQIQSLLCGKGFALVRFRDWEKDPEKYGHELLLQNAPFTTIYGHKGNTEFLLLSGKYNLKTRIECKWQQSSGSVDEKLPYLYLNCIEAMPEQDIIIVIDGGGFKPGAKQWLRDAVDKKLYAGGPGREKNIKVFNLIEFLTWANNKFPQPSMGP